jgi:hypothetical protein
VTVQPGNVITATATDASGNTSEFSPCMLLNGLPGGGALQFNAANFNVNENAGTATVTVDRVGGNSSAVSVHYSMSAGSATAGSDFTSVSGNLNWAAGDLSSKTFTVPIKDDSLNENSETISLGLSSPTGGATWEVRRLPALTIVDDDPCPRSAFLMSAWSKETPERRRQISRSAFQPRVARLSSVVLENHSGTGDFGVDYSFINSSTVTFLAGQTSKDDQRQRQRRYRSGAG